MAARGPDGCGCWGDERCLLGHVRLAINDLSEAGAQPMVDGDVSLVCNGEIYNAPELRRELEGAGARFRSTCDVEVLLHGYRRWGLEKLLDRVQGMYALVIWDGARGVLEAAVDHAGMKPLVYGCRGGTIFIGSDADAVCALLGSRPALDGVSLCHVLCCGYVPAPRTIWEGMGKLGPGRAMRWSEGEGLRVWTHWRAPERCDEMLDEDEEASAFESLWEGVVCEHLLSDEPIGLFLSGGLDSTCVGLALARLGRRDVRALTLGLDGPDDESAAAAGVAAHLGLAHRRIPFGDADARVALFDAACVHDEPQAFGALLTATRLARAAREHGKVMLAGDGGDEAFGGYAWHRVAPAPVAADPAHGVLRRAVATAEADGATRVAALRALATLSSTHAHLQRVFPRFHPAEAAALFRDVGASYDEHVYAGWAAEHWSSVAAWPRRAQRMDLGTFCAGSILAKVDRASMGAGLEVRAPMLDRRVLEFALSRPVRACESEGVSDRPLVRGYLRDRVPAGVLTRPKQGFSLRLGNANPWASMEGWLDGSRLVRDGVLRRDWRSFVPADGAYAQARLFALCFVGAWYEVRA